MVFTINSLDAKVNAVLTLHLEKIFKGYSKLTSQDYVINKDKTLFIINITKKLECGEEYHLKIKTLQHDGSTTELLALFTPKGLFKYFNLIKLN